MSNGRFDRHPPNGKEAAQHIPCSPLQTRLWMERTLARGGSALNAAFRWNVLGAIESTTLATALQSLVARHEILRTSFVEIDGEVVQSIAPTATIELDEFDLVLLSPTARTERAAEIAEAEAHRPFNLAHAPLMRASVVRCEKDRAVLHLTFHGIVVDGWSVGLLIRELAATCAQIEKGEHSELPKPELQYADYALWQQALLQGSALDGERAFWTTQLSDGSRFEVAPDRPRPPVASNRGEIRSKLLSPPLIHRLHAFSRSHGHTRFTIAASALAAVLNRLTGAESIVIGTQVAGRDDALTQQLVGPLMNTLPLHLRVNPTRTSVQILRDIGETIAESLAHQRLPFELMPGVAETMDRPDRFPAYAINLVVQNAFIDASQDDAIRVDGLEFVSVPSVSAGALWDLSFFMVGREEGWRISCEANTDLFDMKTIEAILGYWEAGLDAMTSAPQSRLCDQPRLLEIAPREHAPSPTRPPPHPAALSAHAPPRKRDPALRIARLQPEGHLTPVIVLNNISVYHHVAKSIGAARPFVDIQFYDPHGDRDLPRRAFEDFAADAVRMIRLAQPKGPYILSGLCVYGSLAFEAARQLQREGETIQMVVLFDTWAPGYRQEMPLHDRILRALQLRLSEDAARVRSFRAGALPFADAFYVNRILRKLRLMAPERMPPPVESAWFDEFLRFSCETYRPKPYEGDVAVFRSEEPLTGRLFDRAMGWGPLITRPVPVYDVPGKHIEMFRPEGARAIGDVLRRIL